MILFHIRNTSSSCFRWWKKNSIDVYYLIFIITFSFLLVIDTCTSGHYSFEHIYFLCCKQTYQNEPDIIEIFTRYLDIVGDDFLNKYRCFHGQDINQKFRENATKSDSNNKM